MARTFKGAAKNFNIERHYLKGVIGEGYFAPLVSSEDSDQRKIRINPAAAPLDLMDNTAGTYQAPDSGEWVSVNIEYDDSIERIGAVLETDFEEKTTIKNDRVLVAYGEQILNDNYNRNLLS